MALLVSSAVAQVSRVLPLADVATDLEARSGNLAGSVPPLERLARLVRSQWQNEALGAAKDPLVRRRRNLIGVAENENSMLVSGLEESVTFVLGIVDLLRKGPTRELRVRCTLVHLPVQIATEHALVAGQVTPIDEPTAGKLLKAAVQAKGRVHNLPESKVLPLQPFRDEPPKDAGKGAGEATQLRVRGEAVLVSDQEALFGVQVVRGALPLDPTILPKAPLFDRTFRMRVGTGIVILAPIAKDAPADTPTVALWLQLVDVAAAPPAEKPAASDASK